MSDRIGQQLGNYRLTHLLGQGGFAEVYHAEHIHLNTPAAVKMLYGKLTTQQVQAFVNEAKTIAALKHPSILRILDFGFELALPFLVMDYASGGTLRDRHPDGSVVPLPTINIYVKQVASALAYAHSKKLIHRDVKPENMLIDDDGNILLSDFGIVAVAHSTASMKTIDNIGTVHYMAPEHIQGKPRPASDQYALATIVYEWLCGERPFEGDTSIEIAMRQLSEDPPLLRQKIPSLAPEVEQVLSKALAKDPQQRFPDMLAFANALELASQGQHYAPGSATPSLSTTLGQVLKNMAQNMPAGSKPPAPSARTYPSAANAKLPPTQPASASIPDAKVYENFRKQIQAKYIDKYGGSRVVIVCVPEDQLGVAVHLHDEEDWIKGIDFYKSAYSKKYSVGSATIVAAIFKDLYEEDYIAWIDPRHSVSVSVNEDEASLVML